MIDSLVYLASPYTDPDPAVMERRFHDVCTAAAALLRRGIMVYSPIAHTHPIATHGALPTDWAFWQEYDRLYLQACSRMIVLQLPGWEHSKGIEDEICIMQEMGKPITYMTLKEALRHDNV